MSDRSERENCQFCGHPILRPFISEYCTNCGKLTGVVVPEIPLGDPAYVPKPDDVLFKLTTLRGPTYKFYPEKFEISKGSEFLETIRYSQVEDCEPKFRIYGEGVDFKIRIKLKGNPPREIVLPYNDSNRRLGSDLITWLNIKLAEEDARQSSSTEMQRKGGDKID